MLVPSTRTQFGRRSFHVAAPAVWNALPPHLRSPSISRGQFRLGWKPISSHRPTDNSQNFCWTAYSLHLHIFLQCLDIFSWVTGRASSLLKSLEPANNHGSLSDYWRAPWKNQISSTTMKLRKSLVKPVTWQNISICLVLPPETVMHDAFNVILWTSADICVVVHNDRGWKNWTTRYNCRFSATSLALRMIFVCRKRPLIYCKTHIVRVPFISQISRPWQPRENN